MIERTLVLLKTDAVSRSLIGTIITRFENAGLKIVGMKMVWCDKDRALMHYTEDITKRLGEYVRNKLIKSLTSGPVVAVCFEGIEAVEVVRKIVGSTEPKTAAPGTIRGDFAHMSYVRADKKDVALPNLIHASSNKEEANSEISIWFSDSELHSYRIAHEDIVF